MKKEEKNKKKGTKAGLIVTAYADMCAQVLNCFRL